MKCSYWKKQNAKRTQEILGGKVYVQYLGMILQVYARVQSHQDIDFAAAAAKLLQLCPTLCDPRDSRQPTRLPHPWDSPGKNTGVGCHFLLQCMKVKSESEIAQSCPTLSDPMDCSLPGSSVHGIFQAKVLEWGAIAFSDWKSSSLPEQVFPASCDCSEPPNCERHEMF